jgi:ubiquinone/menaquinone biosynthesis C-methylase UbiE
VLYGRIRVVAWQFGPLRRHGGPNCSLGADIGGGTGNYALVLAHEAWRPVVVVDRSPQMLTLAERKD